MGRKLLTEHINVEGIETFEVYRKHGGYRSVETAGENSTREPGGDGHDPAG